MPDVLTTESTTLGDAFKRGKVVRCERCGTRLVTEFQAVAHFTDVHGGRIEEGTASA